MITSIVPAKEISADTVVGIQWMAFYSKTEKNANSQSSILSNGTQLFQHFSSALIFVKQRAHEAASAGRKALDGGWRGQVPGLKRNKEKEKKGEKKNTTPKCAFKRL